MPDILPSITSPHDLRDLSPEQLEQLAGEMRRALTQVAASRTAHFASNLGVVELCLALHRVFDFSRDRLIWDTGHQIYPHKLITNRYPQFLSYISRFCRVLGPQNDHLVSRTNSSSYFLPEYFAIFSRFLGNKILNPIFNHYLQ